MGEGNIGIAPYFLNLEQMDDSGHIHSPAASTLEADIRHSLCKRLVQRYSRSEHLEKETRLVPATN